jgi:hypothetical protein
MSYIINYTPVSTATDNPEVYPCYYITSTVQASAEDTNVYYSSISGLDCTQSSENTDFAAPIYELSYSSSTSTQPFTVQTSLQMCCMLAIAFGPSNSASSWTNVIYVPNVITTYNDNFDNATVGNGSYPGPSFCQSPGSSTNTYAWTLCIQPLYSASCPTGFNPVPLYFFYGTPVNSYVPITTGTSTNIQSWTILYTLTTDAADAGGNVCDGSTGSGYNGLIGGFMGFPFQQISSFKFMYFQVILVVPYFSGENFAGFVPQGSSGNTTYPGYVIAFYRRQGCYCTDANTPPITEATTGCSFGTDPSDLTNYYPVIYDATNFNEQLTGNLTVEETFNGFLQIATGNYDTTTPNCSPNGFYPSLPTTNLSDYLNELGWLEGVVTTSGGTASGADFGSDTTGGFAGSGWYFCGFLPFNIAYNSTSTDWASTSPNITGANGTFASGNIVMATVENTTGTGNTFWSVLDDTSGYTATGYLPGTTYSIESFSESFLANPLYFFQITTVLFSGTYSCTGQFSTSDSNTYPTGASNNSLPSFFGLTNTYTNNTELHVTLNTNPYIQNFVVFVTFDNSSTNNVYTYLYLANQNYSCCNYGYMNCNFTYSNVGIVNTYNNSSASYGDLFTFKIGQQFLFSNSGCFEYLDENSTCNPCNGP